jgi:sugar/nucleoside kinase (ribokinase family)
MQDCKDVICMGMALVDSIIQGFDPEPVSASGYRAKSGVLSVGGEAVNEAVACARLGLKTGIVCALGEDPAGELILSSLQKGGVDTSGILRDPSRQTPISTIFVKGDGTRKSITNLAHCELSLSREHLLSFTDARAWLLGSLFRAPFADEPLLFDVLSVASKSGVMIFADTKIPNFKMLTLENLKRVLPLIDYITPNEDEAKYFTGKTDPSEMADVFLSYGVKNVIIKIGSKGCYFKNAEKEITLSAFEVEAVDPTGAGDCFLSGFVSEILRGKNLEEALRFANICGAVCTTKPGATTALQSREQVQLLVE